MTNEDMIQELGQELIEKGWVDVEIFKNSPKDLHLVRVDGDVEFMCLARREKGQDSVHYFVTEGGKIFMNGKEQILGSLPRS